MRSPSKCVARAPHGLLQGIRDCGWPSPSWTEFLNASLQICANDLNQIVRPIFALPCGKRWRGHMTLDVVLYHLSHQSVYGTPHRSDNLQHIATADFGLQCP